MYESWLFVDSFRDFILVFPEAGLNPRVFFLFKIFNEDYHGKHSPLLTQPTMTSLSTEFNIRGTTVSDLGIIMHHRRSMFFDMGHHDEAALAAMLKTSEPFFAKRLADGSYVGWLVENPKKEVIAGGGLIIFEYHSSPADPVPRRPIIVNMYTEPAHRRKGMARELMKRMIDWCRQEGFGTVLLHASEDGRSLYQSLGFEPTNEMRLLLR